MAGVQASLMFRQTMDFFKPMFRQLKQGSMVPEMKAGLWMIMQHIQDRNYLAGYDIFMRLAIGELQMCHVWCLQCTCHCSSAGKHGRTCAGMLVMELLSCSIAQAQGTCCPDHCHTLLPPA